MTPRAPVLVLAVLSLLACGGGDDGGGGGGTDGGGAGEVDGGGAGGGAAAMYPLAVGDRWTYQVTALGQFPICEGGTFASEVLDAQTVAGRDAFEVSSFCTGIPSTLQAPDGDAVDVRYQDQWLRLIDLPLEDGHSWPYFNTSYTWRDAGTVTVPAGSFDDCWRAEQDVTYTAHLTYCRGVGLVRSYSSDLGGNGWDAQLASFDVD